MTSATSQGVAAPVGPEYVEWLDHASYTEATWRSQEELEELGPILIKSIGYVKHETDQHIILASHCGENDKSLGEMCILKSTIMARRPVKIGKP